MDHASIETIATTSDDKAGDVQPDGADQLHCNLGLARPSRLVALSTGPTLRWLVATAAVLAGLSMASGTGAEAAQRLVAEFVAAATGGGGAGDCPYDH
jgi:hypothetical protein